MEFAGVSALPDTKASHREARVMCMRIYAEKYTWHPDNLSPITLRVSPPKNTSPFSKTLSPKLVYFQPPSILDKKQRKRNKYHMVQSTLFG